MDIEKVIKGLETCYYPPAKCEDCPYHDLPDEQSCNDTLCLDALAMLKDYEILKKQHEISNELLKLNRRTGKWIEEEPNSYTRKIYCSVCKEPAPFIAVGGDYYGRNMHGKTEKTKYCPNCGARMTPEVEHELKHYLQNGGQFADMPTMQSAT